MRGPLHDRTLELVGEYRASVTTAGLPAREAGKYDRQFYSTMAVAMGLTVFAGFAPTYYWRFVAGGPTATFNGGPFTPLIHVHGALFTAWVVLFIVQTALVSSRRVAVHRRLGVAGAVLAAAMLVAGTSTAIATAARGLAPPGVDPLPGVSSLGHQGSSSSSSSSWSAGPMTFSHGAGCTRSTCGAEPSSRSRYRYVLSFPAPVLGARWPSG